MRRPSMKFSTMAAAAVTALLAGCNLAPAYRTPDLPVPETVSGNAVPARPARQRCNRPRRCNGCSRRSCARWWRWR
jgi:hypothetical protein